MYKKRIRRTATVNVVPGSIPDGENCKSYSADGRNEPHCKMQHYSWLMAQCWIQYKANEESDALNFIWFVKLKQLINHLAESFWSWMNRLSYFSSKYGQIHRFQLLICQYKMVLSICYHSKMNSFAFWTVGGTKQDIKLSPYTLGTSAFLQNRRLISYSSEKNPTFRIKLVLYISANHSCVEPLHFIMLLCLWSGLVKAQNIFG